MPPNYQCVSFCATNLTLSKEVLAHSFVLKFKKLWSNDLNISLIQSTFNNENKRYLK